MQTFWAFILTIHGIVPVPANSTDEDRKGFIFGEVTNISKMYFETEEQCNAAREKMMAGKEIILLGLQDGELRITECAPEEYTVE